MRTLLVCLLMLAAGSAHAAVGNYIEQCSASCVASDGTTQPAGTLLNRVVADPASFAPAGFTLIPDTGQALYAPTAVPTVISRVALLARFTAAEKSAIGTAAATIDSDAWVILHLHLNLTPGVIDLSQPQMQADFATLVGDGLLTAARAAQITNLAVASP